MKRLIYILLFPLLLCCEVANAADAIVIDGGSNRAISIAVVPFAGESDTSVAKIIGNDLYNSGLFEPLPKQNMLSTPHTPKEIAFRDWSAVNAQYVLIGSLANNGSQIQAQYYLYNVASQQMVASGSAVSSNGQIRSLAHYIADQIFLKMTGIQGAFSTKLLYVTARGNDSYSLLMSDYDGESVVTLLNSREPILSPRFSPDNKKVLYVSFETKRPRIYLQDIATGTREQLTNYTGLNGAPAWSPDGQKIAFVLSKDGNPEIYTMRLDSKLIHRLTNNNAIDTEPFWGKDGNTIYFTSDRGGNPQIYKINVNSGATERVTAIGNYNANPKLSADESMLVMVHRQDGYRNFMIAAQNLRMGGLKVLSNTNLDDSPTVAPNGTMVIYATRKQNKGVLMLTSINGRVRVELPTNNGDAREPSWSPYMK